MLLNLKIYQKLVKYLNVQCSNVWNRDCNGATNIYKIAESHINKNIRPSYLCRGNLSDVLDDTSKSKFTRSEMGKPC